MSSRTTVLLLAASFSMSVWAAPFSGQTPTAPTGSVQGAITLADTQRPARFAKVILTPVKNNTGDSMAELEKKGESKVNLGDVMGALMGGVTLLSAQTDTQGRYQLAGVATGDYYLLAVVPGYVSPGVGADPTSFLKGARVLHIDANSSVRGDLTLEKGASVTGRVTYDDGSPVSGVAVQLDPTQKSETKPGDDAALGSAMLTLMTGGLKLGATDDRGIYRIAGVSAGEYTVKATVSLKDAGSVHGGVINLNSFRGASKMVVFLPSTQYKAEAKKLSLKPGEDITGEDILINLAGTHTVSGHVASATDHHSLNAGALKLIDTTDKEVTRSGGIEPDGSFSIDYVPNGSYALKISDAADTVPAPQRKATGLMNFQQDKVVKSYDDTSLPEIVSDHDVVGIGIELKESDKVKQTPNLNGLFGGGSASPSQ